MTMCQPKQLPAWLLTLVAISICNLPVGCSDHQSHALAHPQPSPNKIFDIGGILQGGAIDFYIPVRNSSNAQIDINGWQTSCECLSITPARFTIAPSETKFACVTLNFFREPEFTGELGIEFKAKDSQGIVKYQGLVNVVVVRSSELANGE